MVASSELDADSSNIITPPPIIKVQVYKESASVPTNTNSSATSNPTSQLEFDGTDIAVTVHDPLADLQDEGQSPWGNERENS